MYPIALSSFGDRKSTEQYPGTKLSFIGIRGVATVLRPEIP